MIRIILILGLVFAIPTSFASAQVGNGCSEEGDGDYEPEVCKLKVKVIDAGACTAGRWTEFPKFLVSPEALFVGNGQPDLVWRITRNSLRKFKFDPNFGVTFKHSQDQMVCRVRGPEDNRVKCKRVGNEPDLPMSYNLHFVSATDPKCTFTYDPIIILK